MAHTIPDPLPISCTDCHQAMRIEFQRISPMRDEIIVAAECRCGRLLGAVFGGTVAAQRHAGRPITRHDIDACQGDIGKDAADSIAFARQRIADAERLIAAATWANEGRKSGAP
jgi:hypothetical protein